MFPWNKCMTVYITIIYLINDWISVTHLCSNAVVLNMYQNNVTFSNIEISRKKSLHDKFNHLIFFNLYWKKKRKQHQRKKFTLIYHFCVAVGFPPDKLDAVPTSPAAQGQWMLEIPDARATWRCPGHFRYQLKNENLMPHCLVWMFLPKTTL